MEIADLEIQKQKEFIDQRFEKWRGDNDQVDDILVVGFRVQ